MGLFDVFSNGTSTATGPRGGLLDRLSQANGWTPDARQGHTIAHFFKGDAITPRRDVVIVHTPDDPFAVFSCACRAKFAARSMTTPQLALFLARNDQAMFGKWQISIEDGMVSAHVRYTALTEGLTPEIFKTICVTLVGEVAFVEEALHSQGML